MMNLLLKTVRTLPLTNEAVNTLLYNAGALVMISVITTDDWSYLARLILFRLHKNRRGIKLN